jgi:hypothetical protein
MATMTASNSVTFASGLVAPVESLRLLWRLESEGLRVYADGDDLLVGPSSQLCEAHRRSIQSHKGALIDIVRDGTLYRA